MSRSSLDRRSFLGAGAAAVVGGRMLMPATTDDVRRADAAARAAKRPVRSPRDPVDALGFQTPQPQPGGQVREHWIEARSLLWDPAPSGVDQFMDMPVRGRKRFRAFAYRAWSPGFAAPLGPPTIPGPRLEGTVGDVLKVHFRNGDEHFGQAVTLHPHGVRYTPDDDGASYGAYTRASGHVAPGEQYTYTWECTPDSVGAWPYHDHGPNETLNTHRGLFGSIVVRAPDDPVPDVETTLFFHSFEPQVTGADVEFQCINGRVGAGNTPTVRARVGQDVAFHVFGGNDMLHTFHVHGHRWRQADGTFTDNLLLGPMTLVSARWTEDNPGRWLYHCHMMAHMDAGMAGWYLVEP